MDELVVFGLSRSRGLAERVGERLGVGLADIEERGFEDGEHKTRSLVNVRGRDVYVIHSLYGEPQQSVNDKLCRLLFFIGSLKSAAAGRVTAVVPYLAYARKDRRSQPRDPITTRYVAGMFEAVGVDRVVTLDVHNQAAYENAFSCGVDHLEARPLFVEYFAAKLGGTATAVVSPDAGGMKRAERFRQSLGARLGADLPIAFMEKQRSQGSLSGKALVGDVEGRTAVIYDDLISSGGTIARTVAACVSAGASEIVAAASHGILIGAAERTLAHPRLDHIVVTDTVSPVYLASGPVRDKLVTLGTDGLFAEAIRRLHSDGSLVELLGDNS